MNSSQELMDPNAMASNVERDGITTWTQRLEKVLGIITRNTSSLRLIKFMGISGLKSPSIFQAVQIIL
jgi:hypothetical protein